MSRFPFGSVVQVLHRTGNTFGSPEDVVGCGVAPRSAPDSPVDVWPPVTGGRTVYAPFGSPVSRGDRLVIEGVTYDVDGEPASWSNPFTGSRPGMVIETTSFDDLYTVPVVVRTYLGAGSLGRRFAEPVTVLVNRDARQVLVSSDDGAQEVTEVTFRAPPEAEALLTPESKVEIDGRSVQVVSAKPFTKWGVTSYVEVVCK